MGKEAQKMGNVIRKIRVKHFDIVQRNEITEQYEVVGKVDFFGKKLDKQKLQYVKMDFPDAKLMCVGEEVRKYVMSEEDFAKSKNSKEIKLDENL